MDSDVEDGTQQNNKNNVQVVINRLNLYNFVTKQNNEKFSSTVAVKSD